MVASDLSRNYHSVANSCVCAPSELPGALRGVLGIPQRSLRGTLEVPGALRDASEMPQRCLRDASDVP